jgi:hypothetical protein
MSDEYRIADAIVLANWITMHRGFELEEDKVYNVSGYFCGVKATESLIKLAKKIVRDWNMVVIEIQEECLPPSPSPLCGSDQSEEWVEGFKERGGLIVVPALGEKRKRD